VSVYAGTNGRLRLAGDINRMQDVVDGECRSLITKPMHDDFTAFFAEVDQKVVECIAESGGHVAYDPVYGIDPGDSDPELVEQCFLLAYEYFRVPRPPR
jgi:hypothetical protein